MQRIVSSLERYFGVDMKIATGEVPALIPDERNKAQMIVGKHRNGPTHSGIDLVFIDELAKFENADKGQP